MSPGPDEPGFPARNCSFSADRHDDKIGFGRPTLAAAGDQVHDSPSAEGQFKLCPRSW